MRWAGDSLCVDAGREREEEEEEEGVYLSVCLHSPWLSPPALVWPADL